MTPEQFYDHVACEFPATWPTSPDWVWVNVHDGVATKITELRAVIDAHIASPEVVVVVHSSPGIAAKLDKESACRYIADHVLCNEIQVSDPLFEYFVLIATPGVATGWATPGQRDHSAAIIE